jgi:WD40 repeat protein
MKSLFLKEWRQGRLFLLFGIVLGLLVPVLWVLLAVAFVETASDQRSVDEFLGIMYYVVPPIVALAVASGLIAAEVERGTLPALLALPFSRRRIWAAKALAGLALTTAALALFSIPGALLIRDAMGLVALPAYLPDLAIWCLVAFSVALLCSSLAERTIAALLGAGLICGALFGGALYLVGGLGGRLLGYDDLFDATLWALATVPALLVTSLLTFARGQDLRSQGKWLLAVPALVLVLTMTFAPTAGATRWLTRYVREDIRSVANVSVSADGSTVSLVAGRSPIRYSRRSDGWHGWQGEFRSRHLVLLDLRTGEELVTKRGCGDAAISPDGRLAAVLSDPQPLTWGDRDGPRQLEIWDLPHHRLLYRGYPETSAVLDPPTDTLYRRTLTYNAVEWSPDSQWLAVYKRFGDAHQFLVMNPEGTDLQPLGTDSLHRGFGGWSPDSDVYYLDADVRVMHHSPAQNAGHVVCDPRDLPGFPDDTAPESGGLTVSPDGRFITVSMLAREDSSSRGNRPREDSDRGGVFSFVLRADGSHSDLVYRSAARPTTVDSPGFLWSPDGSHLYFLEPRSRDRVFHWSAASAALASIRLPVALSRGYIRPLPDSSGLLLWEQGRVWTLDNQGQIEPLRPDLSRTLGFSRIVGFDAAGRALILKGLEAEPGNFLAAVDLETGEVTRIYP